MIIFGEEALPLGRRRIFFVKVFPYDPFPQSTENENRPFTIHRNLGLSTPILPTPSPGWSNLGWLGGSHILGLLLLASPRSRCWRRPSLGPGLRRATKLSFSPDTAPAPRPWRRAPPCLILCQTAAGLGNEWSQIWAGLGS